MIIFASLGFSIKNSLRCLFTTDSTTPLTSEETNLSLVCDENLGSGCLTEIIAVMPSLQSSPETDMSAFAISLSMYVLIVLVRAPLKPARCVPPSFCLIVFAKQYMFSLYDSFHCRAISTVISLIVLLKLMTDSCTGLCTLFR